MELKRNIFHFYHITKRNELLFKSQIFLYPFCKTHIISVFKILAVALKLCVWKTRAGWIVDDETLWSGEGDAALHVIQNALTEWERTIKWCVIYTS